MPHSRTQSQASTILNAQLAAERLIERASSERKSVMAMSRDEVEALARQLAEVSDIASALHLERATAGSLPPDSFPGPVT